MTPRHEEWAVTILACAIVIGVYFLAKWSEGWLLEFVMPRVWP